MIKVHNFIMQQLSLGMKISLYKKSSACENPTAFLFTHFETVRDRTITKQVCFERSNRTGCTEKGLQGTVFRVTFSCTDIHMIVPGSVDNFSIKRSHDFISFIKIIKNHRFESKDHILIWVFLFVSVGEPICTTLGLTVSHKNGSFQSHHNLVASGI